MKLPRTALTSPWNGHFAAFVRSNLDAAFGITNEVLLKAFSRS